jgi:hypothetical protein
MRLSTILFFVVLAVLIRGNNITAQGQGDKQLSIVPKIDGKIENIEWKDSKVFKDFYIFIPKEDKRDIDSTVIFMKQTSDALYFAFKFYPRSKVISQSQVRDRSTDEESEAFIILDLENKRQNGYLFAFSYIDNQRDVLIFNQKNQSSEWDWIWENKSITHREATETEPGYIETEIKIPVDKIQNKNKGEIGVNFHMFAYRPDGTSYFYSNVPNTELMSLKNMEAVKIKPFDEKLNLNFSATPFVVGEKFNDSTYRAKLGGEMTASLDKHKFKGTFNTDESTLEADPYSFSFYNRPIYLQEKRPFFSKDLDIYRSQINLFYTRAIQNIDYGFNYTYRSDKLKTGIIYLKEKNDELTQGRDYFVARPKFEFSNLSLGGFFLASNETKSNSHERIISIDSRYRFPDNQIRLNGQFVSNFDGNAYNLYAYYEGSGNEGPYGDVFYNRVDKNFEASTMFNGRVGTYNDYDEVSASGGYQWSIPRALFPTININGGYYRSRTLSDDFIQQDRLSFNFYTKISGYMNFGYYLEYNRPNDFDTYGNIIRKDNFLQDYSMRYILGNNSVYAGYFFGKYYDSDLKNPYFGFDLNLFEKVSLRTSVNYIDVFDTQRTIINSRLDYKVMKKLYLRAFYQRDTYSKESLLNAMVQYEFFAGSNLYLVVNLDGENLEYTRRYFKVGYDFNF